MAEVSIYLNSEIREEAQPVVNAIREVLDAVEGFYGYKLGDLDRCEDNLKAVLWAMNNAAGEVSKLRPPYEFGYSDAQDADLKGLVDGSPFPTLNPYVDRE